MFYLAKFFEAVKAHPIKIGFFSLLIMTTFIISGQKGLIQSKINASFDKQKEYSYFFALISTKNNANRARRKLVQLPGVKEVKFISQKNVQKKVKKILGDIKLEKDDPLMFYDGLKISLSDKLPARGIKLIRDYLKRFVGEGIVLSSVQHPSKKDSESALVKVMRTWGWEIILFGLTAFSIIFFILITNSLKKHFYLLEEFTRRTFVGGKVYAMGISLSFIVAGLILISLDSVFWIGPLLLFAIVQVVNLMNFSKVQWE